MKKRFLPMLALLLAALLLFSACGGNHGQALIKAGDEEISVNIFQLYLSRMRGSLALIGEDTENSSYWKKRDENNATQAELYTARVLEGLKHIAAAMIIYQEMGLKLDAATEAEIDEWIDDLVKEYADGSEATLNSQLSAFGANITVLRDAAILEEKVEQLKRELYGSDASGILDTAKDSFYRQAYYRGKVLWLSNEYYKHVVDADGRGVYYLLDSNKNLTDRIAYDTVNGEEVEENGTTVYRELGAIAYDTENGVATGDRDDEYNLIYYVKDGNGNATNEIAYDTDAVHVRQITEDGETVWRKWVIAYDEDSTKSSLKYIDEDGDGELDIAEYSLDDMAKKLLLATDIKNECMDDEAKFDAAIEAYSSIDDRFYTEKAANGMFFAYGSAQSDALFSAFSTNLANMDEGEICVINTNGAGYYVLMRCELEEDYQAWKDSANSTWFESFNSLVTEYQLQKMTAEYLDRLEIDEDLLATVDITKVATNTVC